jgi:hypothetical protein
LQERLDPIALDVREACERPNWLWGQLGQLGQHDGGHDRERLIRLGDVGEHIIRGQLGHDRTLPRRRPPHKGMILALISYKV